MKTFAAVLIPSLMTGALAAAFSWSANAQDWPQWRGSNRDGKAAGFDSPKEWPKELIQKWKVPVGKGDASPALVGDKVYVFSRVETEEVVSCLDASTGKEIWRQKYEEEAAKEPMGRHPGPRSSPTVAEGKVVTYGVRGTLTCLDASSGAVAWRKNDVKTWPRFFTSSSPLVLDGKCIVQLGGEESGGVYAYDLANGNERWKWTEDGTAYSSPVAIAVGGTKMVVAMTAKRVVGLSAADGKLLWETPFAVQGRAYNAATPIVSGQTVIFAGSGRGTKAVKLEKSGDSFTAKELWTNPENAVQFNTPVVKDGTVYGISQKGDIFGLDAATGKTLWTGQFGGKDFGSVVDAGNALLAIAPPGQLAVFAPSEKEYKTLATYKVAESDTYAYPVPSNRGIYIKDQDSLALWAVK